jgi:carboxypeptidase C (cathepsin A)
MKHPILIGLLSLALASGPAFTAEDLDESVSSEKDAKKEFVPVPPPRAEKTHHELQLADQTLKYTAIVGWLILNDKEKDEPIANFGYTAYTLDGVKDPVRRPITFAFNGGPGSASIWLHMGALGPRRVVVNDGGYAPPPPVQLVDTSTASSTSPTSS